MQDEEKNINEVSNESERSQVTFMLEPLPQNRKPKDSARINYLAFAFGLIVLVLTIFIVQIIMEAAFGADDEIAFHAWTNFLTYVITFTAFVGFLLLTKSLAPLVKQFTEIKPYLRGIFYGFIVIITSVTTTLLMQIIFGKAEENLNQQTINLILSRYPVSSFLWIVLLGPIVEELTYRFGLFAAIAKKNNIAAYIISALVFGFLHFNVPMTDANTVDYAKLIEEFINIPGYIVSGLVFCFIYEKEGLAGSTVAHITNNLVSNIISLATLYASQ